MLDRLADVTFKHMTDTGFAASSLDSDEFGRGIVHSWICDGFCCILIMRKAWKGWRGHRHLWYYSQGVFRSISVVSSAWLPDTWESVVIVSLLIFLEVEEREGSLWYAPGSCAVHLQKASKL